MRSNIILNLYIYGCFDTLKRPSKKKNERENKNLVVFQKTLKASANVQRGTCGSEMKIVLLVAAVYESYRFSYALFSYKFPRKFSSDHVNFSLQIEDAELVGVFSMNISFPKTANKDNENVFSTPDKDIAYARTLPIVLLTHVIYFLTLMFPKCT